MTFGSIRSRLTLYYTAALAVMVALFCVAVYATVRSDLIHQEDQQLSRDLAAVEKAAGTELDEPGEYEQQSPVGLFHIADSGRPVAISRAWRQARLPDGLTPQTTRALVRGRHYNIRTVSFHGGGRNLLISVAVDTTATDYSLHSLLLNMLIGLSGFTALALAGGYVLAGRALAPVGEMASRAKAITAERLSERLPVRDHNDELGRLATAFNSALARLEDSFERLRRFTTDASHELRTPLAAMRMVGEVALRGDRSNETCRDAIGSMLEETERLSRLVDGLLILTRSDAGTAELSPEPIDLAGLAAETVECLRVLAEEKGLELAADAAEPVVARVDRTSIRQSLVNLLDNAIKYTPSGGHVAVLVRRAPDGAAVVEVTDDGPGIPAEHREKVFERFYRIDKSRGRDSGGAGLGLAIALLAVRANGGDIRLDANNAGGSTFRIVLPANRR